MEVNKRNANMEIFEKVILIIQSYFNGKIFYSCFCMGLLLACDDPASIYTGFCNCI